MKTPLADRLDKILKEGETDRMKVMNYVYEAKESDSYNRIESRKVSFRSLLRRYRNKGNVVDVRSGYVKLVSSV